MYKIWHKSLMAMVLTVFITTSACENMSGNFFGKEEKETQKSDSRLQQILSGGELRVGTTGDWNPMTIIDPDSKERAGFDIDIAKELAKDMGVKVVFIPTTWKTLVSGVIADKYDMTSSASLSPKRALTAGYSKTYF